MRSLEQRGIHEKDNYKLLIERVEQSGNYTENQVKIFKRRMELILRIITRNTSKKDTASITSMYDNMSRYKKLADYIINLNETDVTKEDIRFLLRLDGQLIRSISSMQSRRGFPGMNPVRGFFSNPIFQKEGGGLDMELIKCISSMCSGKGIPIGEKKEEVNDFFKICVFQKKGGGLDMELIKCISSMCSGKGIPTEKEVEDFFSVSEFQKIGGGRNMELIKCISTICNGHGIPSEHIVSSFFKIPILQKKGGGLDMEKIGIISSMTHSKGIPTEKEVNDFFNHPVFQKEGGGLDMELIRIIANICIGKGIPTEKEVKDFFDNPIFKKKGEGMDIELIKSISSILYGKGMPTRLNGTKKSSISDDKVSAMEIIREFINIFNRTDLMRDGKRDITLIRCISNMCHGMGIPDTKEVEDFFSVSEFQTEGGGMDIELIKSISNMHHGIGVPKRKNIDKFFKIRAVQNRGGGVNKKLIRSISGMCYGLGIPTESKIKKYTKLYNSIELFWKNKCGKYNLSLETFRQYILSEIRSGGATIDTVPEKYKPSRPIEEIVAEIEKDTTKRFSVFLGRVWNRRR